MLLCYWGDFTKLYAYQQQYRRENSHLHVVEPLKRRSVQVRPAQKRVRKKKVNPFVYLFRLTIWTALFTAFILYIIRQGGTQVAEVLIVTCLDECEPAVIVHKLGDGCV